MQVSAYDLQPSSPARNGRTQGFSVAAYSGATIGGGATGQRYQSAAGVDFRSGALGATREYAWKTETKFSG
jgi:hypothetical protein